MRAARVHLTSPKHQRRRVTMRHEMPNIGGEISRPKPPMQGPTTAQSGGARRIEEASNVSLVMGGLFS